ncbi:ribosome maturation factor RimM [Nakamurella sp. YIM 132087]|uniref:Ribosome maturation factor RimM n=1 Tax=Nakamurella alba TaxID=2665158 RepID=A0A7K1FU17_9ACTN|nr:ribosome maturation factor RimM [Nakamurella alba]MTD16673.1 ribosome maturation factor RimM [Nakamurella alba]
MTGQVQVGRIGRAHGIRGAVTVAPTTDDPDLRFAAGSVLSTDPAERGPLTVARRQWSGQVLVITFEGIEDRTTAETLRGTSLLLAVDELPEPADENDFYDHQLVGLAVVHTDGTPLGTVADVLHPPAAPVLSVTRPDGTEELVPFVTAVVPQVDLAGGRIVVSPPDGMFA